MLPRAALAALLAIALAALLARPLGQWRLYDSVGLAPHGGGLLKDLLAFGLVSLGGLGKLVREPPSDASLEGFHDSLEFNTWVGGDKITESDYFAENFYFWANSPNETSFIYTTRLSFYGPNASLVLPWFQFAHDGEVWNLPDEFEEKTLPHTAADGIEARAPGLGTLRFACDVPMQRWRITYEGVVQKRTGEDLGESEAERRDVVAAFDLTFNPRNVFKYQLHMDEFAVARAMAAKPWTSAFWTNLRAQNQERYASKASSITGYVKMGDGTSFASGVLVGSRDHNFGIRNWRFIHRYIYFPAVVFAEPLLIDDVPYTYFTGAMTEYGDVFENIVVGGLMSEAGDAAPFTGATPMAKISPRWYSKPGVANATLPRLGVYNWTFGVQPACAPAALVCGRGPGYLLKVHVKRGVRFGLWEHSFIVAGGDFEAHEGQSKWTLTLLTLEGTVLQETTSLGMLEFGKNLAGYSEAV